jgi:hypothetical protein
VFADRNFGNNDNCYLEIYESRVLP